MKAGGRDAHRSTDTDALVLRVAELDTPLGPLLLAVDAADALRVVHFDPPPDVAALLTRHRVIGANGSLTGYGGGLERKRWLLAHEGQGLF